MKIKMIFNESERIKTTNMSEYLHRFVRISSDLQVSGGNNAD